MTSTRPPIRLGRRTLLGGAGAALAAALAGCGGNRPAEFDGLTGASVGSGETLEVAVELEDALIDAGYQIRIDTAVEDKRDNRGEIQVPLSSQATSVKGGGQGYIDSFGYSF